MIRKNGPSGAVIDVSNVCRSRELPPLGRKRPVLNRLFLVRDAWREEHGLKAPLELVADRSLLHTLQSEEEKRRLRQLQRDPRAEGFGELRLVPYADPEFLRLARERHRYVITDDQLFDFRHDEPWIGAQPERFLSWVTEGRGWDAVVRLRPSSIRPVLPHQVSRALHFKGLKYNQRLDAERNAAHKNIVRSHWRCPGRDCETALRWPDGLPGWPYVDRDDRPVCECGTPLERLGPRGTTREFVVSDAMATPLPGGKTGGVFLRFPVSMGDVVQIGRGRLRYGINLAAEELNPPLGVRRVSQAHLAVWLENTNAGLRAFAKDLGSGNGTVLIRSNGTEQRIEPGEAVPVTEPDRLVLGDMVVLRLSGQRYFTTEQATLPDLGDGGGGETLLG